MGRYVRGGGGQSSVNLWTNRRTDNLVNRYENIGRERERERERERRKKSIYMSIHILRIPKQVLLR